MMPQLGRHRSPKHDRRRHPKTPNRHQTLEFLAACPNGCTETLMVANGFTAEVLIELIRTGLASAQAERVVAGGRAIEGRASADHRGGAAGTRGASSAVILKARGGEPPGLAKYS
jgi:hypothetical protein